MADDNPTDNGPEGGTPDQPDDIPAGDKRAVLADLAKERDKRQDLERRLAELEPLAQKAQELEDAQKTELQRANDRAAEAEAKAAKAAADALRYRIASKHSISDEDAEAFLTGADEASLTKQAERLVELRGEAKPAPKPDPSQGPRPDVQPDPWAAGKSRAQSMFGTPGN